ncbi:unnamed protein product [Acidithrix sp. C25]|nr:unnamed protein product [Acidithrix sp. C25]
MANAIFLKIEYLVNLEVPHAPFSFPPCQQSLSKAPASFFYICRPRQFFTFDNLRHDPLLPGRLGRRLGVGNTSNEVLNRWILLM